jgi:hypothetical protein
MLYSFDASSIINFFDNYPMDNPNLKLLWDWFKDKMLSKEFVIPKRAFDEVKHKTSDEFIEWFKEIEKIDDTFPDLFEAQKIKDILEIEEDNYGNGVGENDIFIITISKRIGATLVSDEKIQTILPQDKRNYKIPAVCKLHDINFECIKFTDLLKLNP